MNALQLGMAAALKSVTVVESPGEEASGRWRVRVAASDGHSAYGWYRSWEDGAKEDAERLRSIVAKVVCEAIDGDREERCANAMRENAELRKRLAEAEALCDVIRAGAATGLRKDELSEPEQDWLNGQINAVKQIADLLREPHSQAALGHGTRGEGSTAEPPPGGVSTVAPDPLPSSASSAVKESDGGGGAC